MLEIRPVVTEADSATYNARVLVHEDQLVLILDGEGMETYALSDRTIGQVAAALQARHPTNLVVIAHYPFHSASHINEVPIPQSLPDTGINIQAHPGRPEALIGFGAVFSMAEDVEEDDAGLLDQSGFQLDLIGMHQIAGPRSEKAWIPQVYSQFRLGLNSDQRLNVVSTAAPEEEESAPISTPDAQFQTAVEEADQIALTGQFEVVWPLSRSVEVSLVPEYGVSWTRAARFEFPLLRLGPTGSVEPSEQYFNPDLRLLVLRDLRRTLPLSAYGASTRLRFLRDGKIAFYAGGGVIWKEILQRGVRTRRIPGNIIDPNFLQPEVSTPTFQFWRAEFGARLAGIVDVRVDATGAIGNRDISGIPVPAAQDANVELSQILRLVIVKDFPLNP